jgi:outer membrane protein, heavy metal efflux system
VEDTDVSAHRRTFVAGLAASCVACGGTSPYDAAWVSAAVSQSAGHATPTRDVRDPRGADRFVPTLPPGVSGTHALSEDAAVAIALWNSAQFRADLAQLGFTRADLADAAALPNPNLSFLFPVSTRQLELSALYPIAALIQRPWRIASAKYDVERMARALVQSGLDAVRDVRIAWAELEASQRRRALRVRVAELVKGSADLATSRHQSGDVSALEADLVKAEWLAAADLANRGAREESIARARLRMLLGLAESPLGAELAARETPVPLDAPVAMAEAERAALGSRPDLRAAEVSIEAAGERLGLEKARIVQLFARLDAKPVGTRGGAPVLWLPGLTADIPIFNQNPGGRARARAEIERVAWSYLATRQQVVSDVRIAHDELQMALASHQPWAKNIVPLQERNVAAAMQAYEVGGEAYLVVLEATRRLVDARLRELELGLDVRRARARLDRAIGWRIHATR